MIFVTVGSSLPFDRLVEAIDQLVGTAGVADAFAQIGDSRYQPRNMRWAKMLSKAEFDEMVHDAEFIVSHAGIGTIASAIAMGKRVIVMPRRRAFGEAVNDHQVSTADRFGSAGHVLVARETAELAQRLQEVKCFAPTPRTANPAAVAQRVGRFLNELVRKEQPYV